MITRRALLGATGTALGGAAFAQTPGSVPALAGLDEAARGRMTATIEAAKREGSVTYVEAVIAADTAAELARGFRRHYGLPAAFGVNYTLANTGAIVTRLEQELAAGRQATDVVGLAAPSWVFARAAAGDVLQYASPEYAHYKRVFDLGMGRDGYFAFNGAYFFVPMWNAATLKFNGTSWSDVLGAVPPGRINMGNSETSLANLVTYMSVKKAMGDDFYRKLAPMKPRIIQAGEMAHDRVMSGQDLFSLYGQATHVKHRNELGGELRLMIPSEGLVLLPQCLFIMAKTLHPNASRLWLDYVLSAEGQAILMDREVLISGRDGSPSPMPDYKLTLESLKVIPVAWETMTTEDLANARAEWVRTFK